MLEVLMEDRPGDIELAVESINRRSAGWRKKLRDGLARLPAAMDGPKKRIAALLEK